MSLCSSTIPALVLLASTVLGQAKPAQSHALVRPGPVADGPVSAPVVFEGVVYQADGTPASGALVTSSAGGSAVTDVEGRYRLAAEVPLGAESVELVAQPAGGSGGAATTTVAAFSSRGTTPVDPLVLALGANGGARWLPTFGPSSEVSGSIISRIVALTVLDDGDRRVLYAGGYFDKVGTVEANNIASWDGQRWSALGSGVNDWVDALAVYDDGSGPALYAAGRFTTAGGVAANYIARWDGSSWSPLGSGTSGWVHALAVYDDGGGPALYAAGQFITAGGSSVLRIARWDGSNWAPVGGGIGSSSGSDFVYTLAVYDDGNGPALHAGGSFASAGGVSALRIAKWDGTSWSALGSGLNGNISRPVGARAMTVYDDGSGPALYVGGIFGSAGGVPASHIAKWNGSSWSALSSGLGVQTPGPLDQVNALAVFDDGSGPELCAGGTFAIAGGLPVTNIARWDGSGWASMGNAGVPHSLAVFESHGVAALYAGTGGSLERWNGSRWTGIGNGPRDWVRAIASFDDGNGPALYAGGSFTVAGDVEARRIARWDGSSWSAPDGGVHDSPGDFVQALAVFDEGTGPALYVGGFFSGAGAVASSCIVRWDGASWSALGSGIVAGWVSSMTVFDDGSGPALFVGGAFSNAGGVAAADRIAKWDGSSWSSLGSGMGSGTEVNALAVFDDGGGPALYAGGTFTSAGGVPVSYIAKWDGSSWSALGSGMNGVVNALAVFDDGGGPQLYSGSSGAPHYIARWNGASWSPVHGGMNADVQALTVFDDGSGPALFAGGNFAVAGGTAAMRIAKYDGVDWWPVGAGFDLPVLALAVVADGGPPDLYVGGVGGSLDSGDGFLARYGLSPADDSTKVRRR